MEIVSLVTAGIRTVPSLYSFYKSKMTNKFSIIILDNTKLILNNKLRDYNVIENIIIFYPTETKNYTLDSLKKIDGLSRLIIDLGNLDGGLPVNFSNVCIQFLDGTMVFQKSNCGIVLWNNTRFWKFINKKIEKCVFGYNIGNIFTVKSL